MITLIEALNYRSLRYVRQPLGPFHVLVGPNASGKSTFLDVVAFLGRLVSDGVEAAVSERTENFQDLVWGRKGGRFQLAIEAELPQSVRIQYSDQGYKAIRYEVVVGIVPPPQGDGSILGVLDEGVFLVAPGSTVPPTRDSFPEAIETPASILADSRARTGWFEIYTRPFGFLGNFTTEIRDPGLEESWPLRAIGFEKTLLANLPGDEVSFPAASWLLGFLTQGVLPFNLNSEKLRRPSSPNKGTNFRPDGSNLPHVVAELARDRKGFKQWIAHLRTALPDLKTVKTVLRPEDRHRYLMLEYESGLLVPSWMVSDGTLRMMALTLPAYLPDFRGVYLIEEPENGIHPRAVETVYQSLSSVYNAQILTASHSPVMLSCADAKSILCFAKAADGSTDVVRGDLHPQLQHWKGETSIGDLFAAGVLG